ncbi:MAG: NAD-dependent succinate-semialdehyde dehydrogenase [Chloroflexi bacterium]|nr:NAD-dependent succinate-semialdehyde dehydrogenase [Chloroflexota bacterium]
MLIDGHWVEARGGGSRAVIDPATESVITSVPFGDGRDAYAAIDAAARAQPAWAQMTAYERGALLLRAAYLIRERIETLAPIMTRECGKPLNEARGEWNAAADLFEWFAEEGKRAYGRVIPARRSHKRLLVLKEAVGVVATITAWNFPAYLPARKWSAALAAGCTVVGKPSEITPMSAMALVNLLVEAGIPAGVMNLVNGKAEDIGQAFLQSPLVNKISFTGSQRVGQILMRGAADGIKKLALELGGSAPVLIFDDVDVESAAEQAVAAKFRNNGQVCISPARFYAQRGIFEEFLEATRARIAALKLGSGLEAGVTTGPLVTAEGRERVESFVADAQTKGANVVIGGSRPQALGRGFFYQPTLLTNVNPTMRISCDEVFGPVMPVSPFETLADGLRQANATPFGLAGYAMTNNVKTAVRVYEGLKFGIVGVNDLVPATAEGPFGGIKESGFGSEGAAEGLLEYLNTKFVSMGM